MKLAIISDGHLFQSFIKNYDPLLDLKSILQKITGAVPDALLIAGDMFDFKKTQTAYLRHYEGEGLMITVRSTLKDFAIPIYALRGNHEKEEVLKGLEQTVETFHYVKNDWKSLSDVSIYFMDTHFEGELYDPQAVSQIIKQTAMPAETKKTKLLLCHETFAPFPNSLPKETIEETKKTFDWIINGHMHLWNPSAYGLQNVVTLPSAIPSKVITGKYWTEQYTWHSTDTEPKFEERDSPFGYITLDTDKQEVKLIPFKPSRKIVEISVETTSLPLKDVITRFREMLEKISRRQDRNSLILLPEMHGDANFVTTFVKDVFKEYTELSIEELRINTRAKIVTASGKVISAPLLTPEQLFEDIEREFPEIRKKLTEELQTDISIKVLAKILGNIRETELLEKIPPRTTTRLENLLNEIISQLEDIEKPETFEDDMKSVIKRVKE
jgi:DNA repair exonuclease SbcCD nuclease subunit